MGAQSEDAAKFNRASAFYFHLFGYEVLNSVLLLRENELHVLARAEKGAELDRVLGRESPLSARDARDDDDDDDDDDVGKKTTTTAGGLVLKVHTWDSASSVQPLVLAAAAAGPTMGVLRSGGSSSASSSGGALLRAWDAAVSAQGLILVDVTRAVGAALALKDDDAVVRTAAAGRVACRALCDGVTRLVEAAFDADRDERATHDALAQQIDALMCDALAPHCARAVPKLRDVNDAAAKRCAGAASVACANATTTRSTRLVESCYFPIVTSGGACTTDAGAASDADAINDDVVVVEFGARFASYCTNVARTFFVEPLPSLEKCYSALRGVHSACVDAMREHAPLSAVASAAHEYLDTTDASHLAKFLPRHNFGFALGLDFRDDDLVLTRSNSRTFEARMIFNVAIGLHGVPLDAAERRKARGAIRDLKKVSMLIADTVLVQSAGAPPVVLTDFSPTRPALKDWRDVSNLATSQRERAAALAAQRAAAAEAELLAQLDAEAAATSSKGGDGKGGDKKIPPGDASTKSTKKSQKKSKNKSAQQSAQAQQSGGAQAAEKAPSGNIGGDTTTTTTGTTTTTSTTKGGVVPVVGGLLPPGGPDSDSAFSSSSASNSRRTPPPSSLGGVGHQSAAAAGNNAGGALSSSSLTTKQRQRVTQATPTPAEDDAVEQEDSDSHSHAVGGIGGQDLDASSGDPDDAAAAFNPAEEEDEETEAEAAQLLERVRAAGRSRWCESCEAAVKDARDFLASPDRRAQDKSVAALERATADLAESMAAWRVIERQLEQAKSADALRAALTKASNAGFPAKATAVKRARRRLKEIEAAPEPSFAGGGGFSTTTTGGGGTTGTLLREGGDTGLSLSFSGGGGFGPGGGGGTTTLERETNAQIQLGMAASQQAFHEVASTKRPARDKAERPPKPVDELAKYFHGDEHEISQLREQKIDLTKLVILAGRGAPKLAPWRDSQPPLNAVAVGRVLGLLGRLAPRVFVNLNAAERSGLLVRGGSPPREWLALSNDPTEAAGREAEEAAIKHNLDGDADLVVLANAGGGKKGVVSQQQQQQQQAMASSGGAGVSSSLVENKKKDNASSSQQQQQQQPSGPQRPPIKPPPPRAWGVVPPQPPVPVGVGVGVASNSNNALSSNGSHATPQRDSPPEQQQQQQQAGVLSSSVVGHPPGSPPRRREPDPRVVSADLGALFNSSAGDPTNGDFAPAPAPRRTYSNEAFGPLPGAKPSRDPTLGGPPGVQRHRFPTDDRLVSASLENWGARHSAAAPPPPRAPQQGGISSSWDATPDSFGATRDEISAMAGAAYAAALGFGFGPENLGGGGGQGQSQPQQQQQQTKRVVTSSFADAPPPPGVFSAAPGRRRGVPQQAGGHPPGPSTAQAAAQANPLPQRGGPSVVDDDPVKGLGLLGGLSQHHHHHQGLSHHHHLQPPPPYGGGGGEDNPGAQQPRLGSPFDGGRQREKDSDDFRGVPRFTDEDHFTADDLRSLDGHQRFFSEQQPRQMLPPPPGVVAPRGLHRRLSGGNDQPVFPPPPGVADNRPFFTSSVD